MARTVQSKHSDSRDCHSRELRRLILHIRLVGFIFLISQSGVSLLRKICQVILDKSIKVGGYMSIMSGHKLLKDDVAVLEINFA